VGFFYRFTAYWIRALRPPTIWTYLLGSPICLKRDQSRYFSYG
jgi:hypothetical protein